MNYVSTIFRISIYIENAQCLCSQACAVMSMLKTDKRVSVCGTYNLRSLYKILRSVFVRHELPVYNLQTWHLCWEYTMPLCVAYIICQHHIKYWIQCAWHTQFEATMQNTENCVCETWNLRLQSSKLASMLRTQNLCVDSILNFSTLHKVLKSLLVRHQIVPPILRICADCPHTLSLQHAISYSRPMSYFR